MLAIFSDSSEITANRVAAISDWSKISERMDGWLGFNGILSTQVAAISCLRKFKVC